MLFKNRKGQFFPISDTAPRKRFPILTITLIILNIIIFIWSLSDFDFVVSNYGFIPAYPSILTLFTSMFLHGGFDHIFGNMWYLWIFGDNVEDKFGKIKFLFLYFLSGLAADLFHYITGPASKMPTIGASGAISGVLGAYLLLYPKEKVLTRWGWSFMHIPAYIVIGFWFVIQFIFATVSLLGGIGSGIAFWAHIGGFVFGLIFTLLFLRRKKILKFIP